MEALEVKEKLEEAAEGHEGSRSTNLRIGLLIAALAAPKAAIGDLIRIPQALMVL